jgi:hypothetical protein
VPTQVARGGDDHVEVVGLPRPQPLRRARLALLAADRPPGHPHELLAAAVVVADPVLHRHPLGVHPQRDVAVVADVHPQLHRHLALHHRRGGADRPGRHRRGRLDADPGGAGEDHLLGLLVDHHRMQVVRVAAFGSGVLRAHLERDLLLPAGLQLQPGLPPRPGVAGQRPGQLDPGPGG